MKNTIRYTLMVLTILLSFTLSSKAQPPAGEGPMGPPPEMSVSKNSEDADISKAQVEWMRKKLKLNKEQQQSAGQITREHAKKILLLKKKEGYNGATDPGKQQADRERDEAMKKILTEKQFSRFEKNKQVLENSFENSGFGGMPPPPGN